MLPSYTSIPTWQSNPSGKFQRRCGELKDHRFVDGLCVAKAVCVEDHAGEQVRFVIVFITDDAEPKRELLTVFDKIEEVLAVDPLATGRCQGGELFFAPQSSWCAPSL